MPSRNRIKQWGEQQVYHVYNRGNNRQPIFLDDQDYTIFLNLLKRYLGRRQMADASGRPYNNWYGDIELLAFCLMPNHFHLLLYQEDVQSITAFMRGLMTAYVSYFNWRYRREGHLFQDTYKASLIDEDSYWQHISRYIHLNPRDWRDWQWSSLPYYTGQRTADWVQPGRVLQLFEDDSYWDFVADYEDHKAMQDELKHVLAN